MKDYYKDDTTFVIFSDVAGYKLDDSDRLPRLDGSVIKSIKPKDMQTLYVLLRCGQSVEIRGGNIDSYQAAFSGWIESRGQCLCK